MSLTLPRSEIVPQRTWSAVLFDLDGTLIDSAPTIVAALQAMYADLGQPAPDRAELERWVGPPLLDTLRLSAGLNETDAEAALALFRSHYHRVALRAPLYPGVRGLLEDLHAVGLPIALATSKPTRTAREILGHHQIEQFFSVVAGASDDERLSLKAEVVRVALTDLRQRGISVAAPVMVGDRGYDTQGGAANHVPTILVEWGYGSPDEADGALAIVHSVDQLRTLLIG